MKIGVTAKLVGCDLRLCQFPWIILLGDMDMQSDTTDCSWDYDASEVHTPLVGS